MLRWKSASYKTKSQNTFRAKVSPLCQPSNTVHLMAVINILLSSKVKSNKKAFIAKIIFVALNRNITNMKLYEKILEVGSQIISCEKCLNAKYQVVEKSLEEGVIPRTLFAEPFLVDDYQNARKILKDADKARLILLGTAPNQVLSFERVLYKQLLMHMNVLNGSVKLSNEKARSVFERLHDVWLEALGGWYLSLIHI